METNIEIFNTITKSIERPGVETLIKHLKDDTDYFKAPASTRFHLNVPGGLLQHSLNVYHKFHKLLDLHDVHLEYDTIAIVSLFHDLCKIYLYKPNILKSGLKSEAKPYIHDELFPLGHGEKSLSRIRDFISLTPREEIMIRWHMGLFDREFMKYSDKIKDLYPEAILFHMADWSVSIFEDTYTKQK